MTPIHHLLQCFVQGTCKVPDALLADAVVDSAIRRGLGPILLGVVKDRLAEAGNTTLHEKLLAADLSARAISGAISDTVVEIAAITEKMGQSVVLLKGASTTLTVYPSAHFRPMGDIDLLISQEALPEVESMLRKYGYQQTSTTPAEFYVSHHHAMPFFHPQRGLWIELHTALVRPVSPTARIAVFSPESIAANLVTSRLGDTTLQHLRPELVLVHTCVHLVEDTKWDRAIFALVDIALLLRRYRDVLDWSLIAHWLQNTSAFSQLDILLSYLCERGLSDAPPPLPGSRYSDRTMAEALMRRLLFRIIDQHVVRGEPFTQLRTEANVQLLWQTLFGEGTPRWKLSILPWNLLFPPTRSNRFSPSLFIARIRSALGYGNRR